MNDSRDPRVNIGIAGLGRSGWGIHAAALEGLSDKYKIAAVADASARRQKEAAGKFGCRTYSDFESLAADGDVELLTVATPNQLHREHAILALKAGKDVVCEKPMAPSVADANAMIDAAGEAGRVLTVFQSRRYSADFIKVREVIQSGLLGRIMLIRIADHRFSRRWDWQTLKEFGGGALYNRGAHYVDMGLQFFGDADPRVTCQLDRALASGDADDHCKVVLRAAGAPVVDVEMTSACAYPQERWLVMGTRGGLAGDGKTLRWKYVEFDKLPDRPVDAAPTPDRTYNKEELPWREETWQDPKTYRKKAVPFYLDLYDTLRNGAPLVITPESVHRQLAVLEKCRELCPL